MSGWIKICGVTREEDVDLCVSAGVDAIGFNLWPRSPRSVDVPRVQQLIRHLAGRADSVLVTVDQPEVLALRERLGAQWVQLHGDEVQVPEHCFRAIGLDTEDDVAVALDAAGPFVLVDARDEIARGGTGRTPPWALAARVARSRQTVLAGGLGPSNVAAGIGAVHPWGVDSASGVESGPGVKDAAKVRGLVAQARRAFAQIS